MLTKKDIQQIQQSLQPQFDSVNKSMRNLELRFENKLDETISQTETNLTSEIQASEQRLKQYVHESADAVIEGVDHMFKEHETKTEKTISIYPA